MKSRSRSRRSQSFVQTVSYPRLSYSVWWFNPSITVLNDGSASATPILASTPRETTLVSTWFGSGSRPP